ncbi:MAG: hypothetical protein JNM89_06165 [Hyphomicrobiaceae bacterium]|nr:hypothetical protein [Hyphomicrobiaceae bacterium]
MNISKKIATAAFLTAAMIGAASAQIGDRSAAPSASPGQSTEAPVAARSAPQPQAFLAPEFVSSIVRHPLSMLAGDNSQATARRRHYLVGFSIALDRSCDFLTAGTVRELLRTIAPALELANESAPSPANKALLLHLTAGIKDGEAFIARNTCGSVNGQQVKRSLAALWESI